MVDRSEQQSQEIAGADRPPAGPAEPVADGSVHNTVGFDGQMLDTNTLLSQLMAEVSSNVDEQGAWSQWWPPMEEVELPVTDQGMSMLL